MTAETGVILAGASTVLIGLALMADEGWVWLTCGLFVLILWTGVAFRALS